MRMDEAEDMTESILADADIAWKDYSSKTAMKMMRRRKFGEWKRRNG